MNVGDWIDIPVLIRTKGGGKRRVGTDQGKIVYIAKKYVTVWNGRYNDTFTYQELNIKQEEVIR